MPEILFWLSLSALLIIYAGYPALMVVVARGAPAAQDDGDVHRSVTILIAARDEGHVLRKKLESCLDQVYPENLIDILLVSDGSEDNTVQVAKDLRDNRIGVVQLESSVGKAAALNQGMERATGEIVVLTDARQPLSPSAVQTLVAAFRDESVGGVSGDLRYDRDSEAGLQAALHRYWDYEKGIRLGESRVHSCVGATGALYAIRRGFWVPLPPGLILDDVFLPMKIVLGGRRVIFEPRAWAEDVASVSDGREFRRRVRTLTGNYQLLTVLPELLVPFKNPIWVQFLIHKTGRLVSPFLIILLFASSIAASGSVYAAALIGQMLFWVLVALGYAAKSTRRLGPILALPYAFAVTQAAAVVAFAYFLKRDWDVWVR